MTDPVATVARSLRCTEGQLYTLVIGLVVAALLALTGIPAVLRSHPAAPPVTSSPSPPSPIDHRGPTP